MASIKFDNTEIVGATYTPRFIKHESMPERILGIEDISSDNGSVLINQKFGTKRIPIQGVLVGSSQADLESKIDVFKELFSRVGKNLDIDWNGSTRRYVATCSSFSIDRDHYHISYVPWTAEFIVPSGIGEDTSETALQAATNFNLGRVTSTLTFAGSAPPKPRFTIETIHTSAVSLGILLKNNDNGQGMFVPLNSGIYDNDKLEIDCRLKTVRATAGGYYGTTLKYYGQFPEFVVGPNSVSVQVGDVIDQEFSPSSAYHISQPVYGSLRVAQKFTVANSDVTYRGISLKTLKIGTISSGYMTVEIQTDANGAPSGTAVSHATFRYYADLAPIDLEDWIGMYTDTYTFSLSADTPYWIVVNGNSIGDSSNYIIWCGADGIEGNYKRGHAATYDGSWTIIPGQDQLFKLNFFGTINAATPSDSLKVDYYKRYL